MERLSLYVNEKHTVTTLQTLNTCGTLKRQSEKILSFSVRFRQRYVLSTSHGKRSCPGKRLKGGLCKWPGSKRLEYYRQGGMKQRHIGGPI